ncbi:MAG: hypothetical protein K1X54_03420 [Flavobacteriales bacterium]|nr:hypothetical protein [Flavobacteriales bacterium]
MNINRENYEVWLIDYLDGNLNDEAVAELHAFLLLNPDIAEEFNALKQLPESFPLPSELNFHDKESLKKTEDAISPTLNELLAKSVESDLNPEEQLQLKLALESTPGLWYHFNTIHKTKLIPPQVVFGQKSNLLYNLWPDGLEDEWLIISIIEGEHNQEQLMQFESRIKTDLDFRHKYEALVKTKLNHIALPYPYKSTLIFDAQVDMSNIDMILAALAEGDLTGKEKSQAEKMMSADHTAAKYYQDLLKTKLTPPVQIRFEEKSSLYRKATVVIPLRRYFAYAGGVAAAVATLIWFSYTRTGIDSDFAQEKQQEVVRELAQSSEQTLDAKSQLAIQAPNNSPQESTVAKQPSETITPEHPSQTQKEQSSGSQHLAHINSEFIAEAIALEPMKSLDGLLPIQHHLPELDFMTPDMALVYQQATEQPNQSTIQPAENLFTILGRAAADKLENTLAYSLAERQVTRLENVKKETQEVANIETEDRLRIKLGPFSIDRERLNPAQDRDRKRHGLIGLVEQIVDKATGR